MTLQELLERVEKATGPNFALDCDISEALKDGWYVQVPNYTGSTEAALGLVEREWPDMFWIIGRGKVTSTEKLFGCHLMFGTDEIAGAGESDALPLAILSATLRALIEQEKREDEWRTMDSAPRDGTAIQARIPGHGSDNIIAWLDGLVDSNERDCGGWSVVENQEPPADWTDGICWTVNEDGKPSTQPIAWKPIDQEKQRG